MINNLHPITRQELRSICQLQWKKDAIINRKENDQQVPPLQVQIHMMYHIVVILKIQTFLHF